METVDDPPVLLPGCLSDCLDECDSSDNTSRPVMLHVGGDFHWRSNACAGTSSEDRPFCKAAVLMLHSMKTFKAPCVHAWHRYDK